MSNPPQQSNGFTSPVRDPAVSVSWPEFLDGVELVRFRLDVMGLPTRTVTNLLVGYLQQWHGGCLDVRSYASFDVVVSEVRRREMAQEPAA